MKNSMFSLFFKMEFVFLTLMILSTVVAGECTCEPDEDDQNKALAFKYKMTALASILVAGAAGVCLPVVAKNFPALSPESNLFFIVKAFAAGVILSTGFIHVLPDAFESLTSPCIGDHPWGDFPFAGFIAMLAAIATLTVESHATSYFRNRTRMMNGSGDEEERPLEVHNHTHGHALDMSSASGESEHVRRRIISQVLELGIIVHSVIIGIALGASQSPKTIKPLIAALTFHQFFEGIGLGGTIMQANFNARAVTVMVIFFSLTTPAGIAIGIGISNIYSETSAAALIVQGVFNSASAGILVYMALVDLLATDFLSPKLQDSRKIHIGANLSLLIGAGCMSLLAKWA